MPTDEQRIWDAIRASNEAWFHGKPELVRELFHEQVIMVAPDLSSRLVGREAVVHSYVEFCRLATTLDFKELDHHVSILGDTAVATYRFSVRYKVSGQAHEETGQEVLVFTRHLGKWEAIWRTQVTLVRDGHHPSPLPEP